MSELQNQIFKLGKMHLKSEDAWNFIDKTWVMTSLCKVRKSFFGLVNHKCPLCQTKIFYYTILFSARDDKGIPVGKQKILPPAIKQTIIPLFQPLGNLQFGICPFGHKIARFYANRNGTCHDGYVVYQFTEGEMIQIASP